MGVVVIDKLTDIVSDLHHEHSIKLENITERFQDIKFSLSVSVIDEEKKLVKFFQGFSIVNGCVLL